MGRGARELGMGEGDQVFDFGCLGGLTLERWPGIVDVVDFGRLGGPAMAVLGIQCRK